MISPRLVLATVLLLGACDGDGGGGSDSGDRESTPARATNPMQASAWQIGPVISSREGFRNYSLGLPSRPEQYDDGWGFAISPTAEPHYITFRHGPLTGKSQISMRYRVEAAPETVIHGKGCSVTSPSAVTLYFQKAGDDWRTDGDRWWASFAAVPLRGAGEHEIVAPLNARWTSVLSMTAEDSPAAFAAAKRSADRVGFTFANCEGRGHGARATGPVRFVVTDFRVE